MIVAKVSRRGDDHAAWAVTGFEEFDKITTLKAVDGFLAAADRPANRMILEEIEAEQIVNVIVRRVFGLRHLLKNHRAFALDLVGIEARMEKNIG